LPSPVPPAVKLISAPDVFYAVGRKGQYVASSGLSGLAVAGAEIAERGLVKGFQDFWKSTRLEMIRAVGILAAQLSARPSDVCEPPRDCKLSDEQQQAPVSVLSVASIWVANGSAGRLSWSRCRSRSACRAFVLYSFRVVHQPAFHDWPSSVSAPSGMPSLAARCTVPTMITTSCRSDFACKLASGTYPVSA